MSEAIKIRKRTYWNTETFKERMKEINPNIEVLGEYINLIQKQIVNVKYVGIRGVRYHQVY